MNLDPKHIMRINGHLIVVYILIGPHVLRATLSSNVDWQNITDKMLPGCPPIRIQYFHLRCNIEKCEDIHDIVQFCVFYMQTHPTPSPDKLHWCQDCIMFYI